MVLVEQRQRFPGRVGRRIAVRGQIAKECLWRAIAFQKGVKQVL
jgi:hypothetical protein